MTLDFILYYIKSHYDLKEGGEIMFNKEEGWQK